MSITGLTQNEVSFNVRQSIRNAKLSSTDKCFEDRMPEKRLPKRISPDTNGEDSDVCIIPRETVRARHCQKTNGSIIPSQRKVQGQKKANDIRKVIPLKEGSIEVIQLVDEDDVEKNNKEEEDEEKEEEFNANNDVEVIQRTPHKIKLTTRTNSRPSLPVEPLSTSFRKLIRSKLKDLVPSDLETDTQFLESFLIQPLSVKLNVWPPNRPLPTPAEVISVDWEQETKFEEALNLLEYRGIDVDHLINDAEGDSSCEEMSEIQEDFSHILTDPIDEPGDNFLIGTNTFGWVTVAREQYEETVPLITLE